MKKYFLFFLFLIFSNYSYAEEKFVYLDVNFLLTESESGKYINNELNKINDNNIEEFKKIENSIKTQEDNLLKQKNILKEEEFNSKLKKLREKYQSYQELKKKKNNDLKKLRDDAVNQILKIINDVLTQYSTKNNISLVIEKKNVIIGKTELDITKDILNILNKKIKKVEIN
tara:strand:- start:487 stop:1002 length:516 start_codon:yes stop_codon:yes gene_type:complete